MKIGRMLTTAVDKMGLNEQKGNMYGFVTHTWNAIKGKCVHNCAYCYMKRFPQKDLWFDEKELKTDLGEGNFIFVGSSTDMFADNVPREWIAKVLSHCMQFRKNTYLLQTKNPERIAEFFAVFPEKTIIGTTIETNRDYKLSNAPTQMQRAQSLSTFQGFRKMITIEPVFDFDVEQLVQLIKEVEPEFVNIGADSNVKRDYGFPEPSKDKVMQLIKELQKFTEVKNKHNLGRILNNAI